MVNENSEKKQKKTKNEYTLVFQTMNFPLSFFFGLDQLVSLQIDAM
jgi:hypothetical protein